MAKITDHSGDQQAAPTPRERMGAIRQRLHNYTIALSAHESDKRYVLAEALHQTAEDAATAIVSVIDALDPVLATVERLEAAEKSRTVDKPTASPPVPPSPPAARLQVGDYAFERTNRTSSGWRIMESTRLADLEGPVGPVLAAVLDELARLRARLADGVRGTMTGYAVGERGTGYAAIVTGTTFPWPVNTPVLVLPDEPEGQG